MKGETAIGTGEESAVPVGQHSACGMPMVMIGRKTVRKSLHPDQISSMEARDIPIAEDRAVDVEVEYWQCPCGCTKKGRDL